jgi:hypothetical protein
VLTALADLPPSSDCRTSTQCAFIARIRGILDSSAPARGRRGEIRE